MNYRLIFIINAIVLAVFGMLFLILPELTLTQFGTEIYVSTLFVARFLGGAMLMAGVLIWFTKDIQDAGAQKNMAFTLLAASVVGFILSLIGVASASAVIRSNGWVLLVLHVLFGLGYAYLLFLKPQSSEAKPRSPRKAKGATK
jgi:hypothetical protein